MAKLKVSPNVVVKASPKLLDLSGNVDIPWARIAIESLPDNAEPVSEDEVILNGPRKVKKSSSIANLLQKPNQACKFNLI